MRKHKWLKIMGILVGVMALTSIFTMSVFAFVDTAADTDDAVADAADILNLSISSAASVITVDLILDGNTDNKFKYRVHFDTLGATAQDFAITNTETGADCRTTSDDTSKRFKNNKQTGPGSWAAAVNIGDSAFDGTDGDDDFRLRLTVPYSALTETDLSQVDAGDVIYIWADTQWKGSVDRAPDNFTDGSDFCEEPQGIGEVVQHTLN